jgi:hypothetical protein
MIHSTRKQQANKLPPLPSLSTFHQSQQIDTSTSTTHYRLQRLHVGLALEVIFKNIFADTHTRS